MDRPRGSLGPAAPETLRLDASLRCGSCGTFGAFDLGDRQLCEECYRAAGSCCPEFGAGDLWREDE